MKTEIQRDNVGYVVGNVCAQLEFQFELRRHVEFEFEQAHVFTSLPYVSD